MVDKAKIIDGATPYFFGKDGDKEGGLLGKVILYIQPNLAIMDKQEGQTPSTRLLQLRRYREGNKLVSPDWGSPERYGGNIGAFIRQYHKSYGQQ